MIKRDSDRAKVIALIVVLLIGFVWFAFHLRERKRWQAAEREDVISSRKYEKQRKQDDFDLYFIEVSNSKHLSLDEKSKLIKEARVLFDVPFGRNRKSSEELKESN